MINNYVVNSNTLAIISLGNKTKIIENNKEFIIYKSMNRIINEACKIDGLTYMYNLKRTVMLTGYTYKTPIILRNEFVFFPTTSPRIKSCKWINFNNINKWFYDENSDSTKIIFNSGYELDLSESYNVINNQILKSNNLIYKFKKIVLNG